MYLIWFFGSKLIRSNSQSRATLWVLETCLIVGTSSLYTHLDHCFVVLQHIQQSFLMRRSWRLREHAEHFSKHWRVHQIARLARDLCHGRQRVSSFYHGFWVVFPRTKTIRSHKSRAGIPSNLNPASKEMILDSVELCGNWSLLHTHPTYWNKCVIPKMHSVPPEVDFESSRSPREIRVLKQSQPALFAVLPT